jgi:nucleotide-binding universal stress UspA family protein
MPATLMIHLMPGVVADSFLQLAGDVAARIAARKVVGISALRPLQIYAGPDAYVPQDLFEQDWATMEKELAAAENRFRAAFAGKVATVAWRSTITTNLVSDYVAAQMRMADLLVTTPAPRGLRFEDGRYLDVADLALKAGRPVLIANPGIAKLDLGCVVVGWNDSRESRRALRDAVPLLRLAGRITVVEVAADEDRVDAEGRVSDVAEWLKEHDILAAVRVERGGGADAAAVLSDVAQDLKAGLVVAGAYGHSRLREWVLGGVTRDLLLQPAQCTLISH